MEYPMGNFAMSLALVAMLTGTSLVPAAPVLVKSDIGGPISL